MKSELATILTMRSPIFPLYLDLYRRGFQSSVNHRQHAVLDVLRRCFGQQQVHLLEEDQQDLHSTGTQLEKQESKAREYCTVSYWLVRLYVEVSRDCDFSGFSASFSITDSTTCTLADVTGGYSQQTTHHITSLRSMERKIQRKTSLDKVTDQAQTRHAL